jgi:hypothetical protein
MLIKRKLPAKTAQTGIYGKNKRPRAVERPHTVEQEDTRPPLQRPKHPGTARVNTDAQVQTHRLSQS